jgi:hypothetical protein
MSESLKFMNEEQAGIKAWMQNVPRDEIEVRYKEFADPLLPNSDGSPSSLVVEYLSRKTGGGIMVVWSSWDVIVKMNRHFKPSKISSDGRYALTDEVNFMFKSNADERWEGLTDAVKVHALLTDNSRL